MLIHAYPCSCVLLFASGFTDRCPFLFHPEAGIRDWLVTGVQKCAFFFSSRRRHTRLVSDWSSDVCSSDLSRTRHTRLVSDWSSDVCSSDRRAHVTPVTDQSRMPSSAWSYVCSSDRKSVV